MNNTTYEIYASNNDNSVPNSITPLIAIIMSAISLLGNIILNLRIKKCKSCCIDYSCYEEDTKESLAYNELEKYKRITKKHEEYELDFELPTMQSDVSPPPPIKTHSESSITNITLTNEQFNLLIEHKPSVVQTLPSNLAELNV